MTKATVRDHKVGPSGFFAEFSYSWKDRDLDKELYFARDRDWPLKIKVPTDMGMLALCAKYKMTKGLDIRFITNINGLTEALELLYKEVKDSDADCKKSIIYSVARSDFRWDEGILMHVVPLSLVNTRTLRRIMVIGWRCFLWIQLLVIKAIDSTALMR